MSDEKQEEQEVILETEEPSEEPVAEDAPQEEPAKASEEGELESYSKGVQNRIKKLTERYRQEERDKAEAVRLSQQLLEENKRLKTRVQSLDSGYLNEYGNRLESQTLAAKQMYKEAHEAGDPDKMLEAQELISKIAVERQKYESAKKQAETSKLQVKKKLVKPDAPQQQQPQAQQPPAQPDPKAQAWAEENKWFGEDRVMTMAAFAINQQLLEEEGFDPTSDEYYTEIDSRIRKEFPHKFEEAPAAKKTGGGSQVASAGNSASRSTKQGRRSVKLSHSQVAIAKKLGVPLEEYAKYVKE
jgi:hypothetical protein